MVPILLCLGAWGWSRSHSTWIGYGHHGRFVMCESWWGSADVQWGTNTGEPDGWWCQIEPQTYAQFWPDYRGVNSFLGFRYSDRHNMTHTSTRLGAPWWFLIIVFSAILFVVWRKTRPRGTGRAFPVELTAPRSEPGGKTQ